MKNILWMVLLVGLVSCDNLLGPGDSPDYFPLAIGNQWTYKCTKSGGTEQRTYTITGITEKNNHEYYRFDPQLTFFPVSFTSNQVTPILRQNKKGDILICINELEFTFFRFDESLLDSTLIVPGVDHALHIRMESCDETVETEAARFNHCFKFFLYYPEVYDVETYVWFAPGYGPVKIHKPAWGSIYELTGVKIR